MRRLQIYIDEHVDEALALRALREGTSKAALIRQFVAERIGDGGAQPDPLDAIVGASDQEPGDIDAVVYDRQESSQADALR